jgi:hypothetical protein
MTAAIAYAYRYQFPSVFEDRASGQQLRLATSGGTEANPHFFRGKLVYPRLTADLLLFVSRVSSCRFYSPEMRLAETVGIIADPVVTSGGERLRFESFSLCCGVYARLDMKPDAIDGEWVGRGTTNVDFNLPMQKALSSIRDTEQVGLNVGADEFELERNGEKIVEKKVLLSQQWLKSFVEVQSYQSRMKQGFEISGQEAQRFIDALAEHNVGGKGTSSFVVPAGRGLRLSHRNTYSGVPIGAPGRLKVFGNLARKAKTVRVYTDGNGTTAWAFNFPDLTATIALTADAARGFSGEGQILQQLAAGTGETALARVRSMLEWQARLDAESLSQQLNIPQDQVLAALSMLGTRGLVGYDLESVSFYHRELPFNAQEIESTQPRLTNARRLVNKEGVRITKNDELVVEAYVDGDGSDHFVVLNRERNGKCTCPWYIKHSGKRGPCRHVLAVQLCLQETD